MGMQTARHHLAQSLPRRLLLELQPRRPPCWLRRNLQLSLWRLLSSGSPWAGGLQQAAQEWNMTQVRLQGGRLASEGLEAQ